MKSHGGVVAVLALCASGACVKVPAFEGKDATISDGNDGDAPPDGAVPGAAIAIAQNGNAIGVTGPGYQLNFSTDGARFPYQLIVGGNYFLGGAQQCADELDMGVAIYPVQRLASIPSSGTPAPVVTVPLSGPWVGQVRIEWSTSFECGNGTASITGISTFSFFPNGRLTRFDRLTNNGLERTAADCTACTGGSGSNFFVTSYTTLIVDSGAVLTDGNEATLVTYGQQVTNPGPTTCVNQRGQSIAFSWVNAPTRLRVVSTSPRSIAFVKDMHTGATLSMDTTYTTTTQLGISSSETCVQLENRIAPFSDSDHRIVINGVSSGAALTDGIFGGYPRETGYPVDFPVTITPGQTIAPRMPAGFAVWLYSTSIPANLTLTHSGGHTGTWYRLQRVGQDQLVVWFEVSLEQGEMITISGS